MTRPAPIWCRLAAVTTLSLLGACTQDMPPASHAVASNPPLVAPGPKAVWYTVSFNSSSYAIDPAGQRVVDAVIGYLQHNPGAVATIIGRTDTVGSDDYNMRLSHHRADAVRDSLVYGGRLAVDRVETRWTGDTRQDLPTGNEVAAAENRVVDIAIH
jgi:OOP family OmpA-OmpF porin